jgi:hypothetical protein
MNQKNAEEFRRVVDRWKDVYGYTNKELYQHVAKQYGKSGYWLDSRIREVTETTEDDLVWITEQLRSDPNYTEMTDVDQYTCYDCEESHPGLPFYTMISSTRLDPGAFLCHFCFKGLEKRGLQPDVPGDPRQIIE